jgi:uncharacterized protein (DUF1800 family)
MKIMIFSLIKTSLFAVLLLGTGCGGGSSTPKSNTDSPIGQTPVVTPPSVMKPAELDPDYLADPQLPTRTSPGWDKAVDASRFLAQTSFGATAKDIDYIVKNGKSVWFDNQFALAQTSQLEFLDKRLTFYGFQPVPPVAYFDDMDGVWGRYILRQDIWWETAVWGQDQLRQRLALTLSQILVVSQLASEQYARERGFANYHDILAKHAFGNYKDLLLDVSLNPIMGIYLSALNNPKADEKLNIRPDENYAREILQLFSIGLNELNNDGSLKLDAQGNPIYTFNQEIVKEFSRVFTGWSMSETQSFGDYGSFAPPASNTEPMKAYPAFHDAEAKILLNGEVIPAGQAPLEDVKAAINNIMAHKNVAPFIGKKLIQYLVTSNPSPAYIERVSKVFNDNGKGVKGDMKAVIKAIYLDDEARTPPQSSQYYYGKLKEYPLLVSGLWRAFKAQGVPVIHNGKGVDTIRYMNGTLNAEQEAFFAPSVFNFYQSEYSPPGALAKQKLLAPEFQIFNANSAVLQANLLAKMIYHRDTNDPNLFKDTSQFWGADIKWNNPPVHAKLNLTEEIALANTPEKLVDRLNLLLTQGQITAEDSALISAHISLLNEPLQRVYEAVFLIVVSPEYAIQR